CHPSANQCDGGCWRLHHTAGRLSSCLLLAPADVLACNLTTEVAMLLTPQMPVANSICERVIGSLRRECLDFMIPLNERHLYHIVHEWVAHYNEGRPHMSLGPGIPQPRPALPVTPQAPRHQIPTGQRVVARSVLGGLHHDYRLERRAA